MRCKEEIKTLIHESIQFTASIANNIHQKRVTMKAPQEHPVLSLGMKSGCNESVFCIIIYVIILFPFTRERISKCT
jgi:hypothetical protein